MAAWCPRVLDSICPGWGPNAAAGVLECRRCRGVVDPCSPLLSVYSNPFWEVVAYSQREQPTSSTTVQRRLASLARQLAG